MVPWNIALFRNRPDIPPAAVACSGGQGSIHSIRLPTGVKKYGRQPKDIHRHSHQNRVYCHHSGKPESGFPTAVKSGSFGCGQSNRSVSEPAISHRCREKRDPPVFPDRCFRGRTGKFPIRRGQGSASTPAVNGGTIYGNDNALNKTIGIIRIMKRKILLYL